VVPKIAKANSGKSMFGSFVDLSGYVPEFVVEPQGGTDNAQRPVPTANPAELS
jgi:hypothetical protein